MLQSALPHIIMKRGATANSGGNEVRYKSSKQYDRKPGDNKHGGVQETPILHSSFITLDSRLALFSDVSLGVFVG